MIIGLHHVHITIPKGTENEARKFYSEILGLKEIEKPDALKARGGLWLQLGNLDLHIGVQDGVERNRTKAHVAYQVEDILYWKKLLEENNINILESVKIPNYERFECRDPFGNRVEIIQEIKE